MANRIPSFPQTWATLPRHAGTSRRPAAVPSEVLRESRLSYSQVPRAKVWKLLGAWEGLLWNGTEDWEAGGVTGGLTARTEPLLP